ncbi:MAG TPA: glycosyltransferase family 4 protein [Gemmatimonadaceae bacterium]|nr:glycosyltransferase family 4 protein [Gemmatimonadaceae bacterium]
MLNPENTTFIVVSFEGPDPYSQAGGLGIRVTGLVKELAESGYPTHLFFIGDPNLPGEEHRIEGKLTLHRWGQWISQHYSGGVYDGEDSKRADLTRSLPPYVVEHAILPALNEGRVPVLLLEEWQTADTTTAIADLLRERGARPDTLIFWNANNSYGFEHIDWQRLMQSATVTAVSRYMRSIIRSCGADALVIPNGIGIELLQPVRRRDVAAVRAAVSEAGDTNLLFKMARWERTKGWNQALEAVEGLRDRGRRTVLLARSGGPSGVGGELANAARERGLRVMNVDGPDELTDKLHEATAQEADVVNLRFGVASDLARSLYAAADGVLANSVYEPFGLVGLEAMAAGGVVYTGGTGEDYAVTGRNAVVLETLDPDEIVQRCEELAESPERANKLRRNAKQTARLYTWKAVMPRLVEPLQRQARRQGLLLEPSVA